ncbi:MAG: acyl-CoA thioesterase [Chitinophagaceae bacterium]
MARIHLQLPPTFPFSTHIPVRIQDINYGNHLGNDALLSILHEARLQYLIHIGCSEINAFGAGLILVEAVLLFKSEGFYGDTLEIRVAPEEVTTKGFALLYQVNTTREDRVILIATARTSMLCFDYSSRKVMTMPLLLQEVLQKKY